MIRTRIWRKFRGCLYLLLGIVFHKRGILSSHFKLPQEWRFPSTSFSNCIAFLVLVICLFFSSWTTRLHGFQFHSIPQKIGVSIVSLLFLLLIWYGINRAGDDLTWSLFHYFIMKMELRPLDNWNKGCSHCVLWNQKLRHWTKKEK